MKGSYYYWETRLIDFQANVFAIHINSIEQAGPALKLANEIPDISFERYLGKRDRITLSTDKMVRKTGCLISLIDIKRSVNSSSLWEDLKEFQRVATTKDEIGEYDEEKIERSTLICRELYDLARRYTFCEINSKEFNVSMAELLALYRQEGAFYVTPPASSYTYGPLIQTEDSPACRTHDVTFRFEAKRPGFNLYRRAPTYVDLTNEISRALQMVRINFITIGGLDTIVHPKFIKTRSCKDELEQFYDSVLASKENELSKTVETHYKPNLSNVQLELYLKELLIGLLRSEIEFHSEIPDVKTLLELVANRITNLTDSHKTVEDGTYIYLSGDNWGTDTLNTLSIQAQWYSSRSWLRTLIAHRDRSGFSANDVKFTPFLNYLRYHMGDLVFVGLLLRTATNLKKLYGRWRKEKGLGLLQEVGFPSAFLKSNYKDKTGTKTLADCLKFWRSSWLMPDNPEAHWHNVGLIAAFKNRGNFPDWLSNLEVDCSKTNSAKTLEVADFVREAVNSIVALKYLDPISLALEYTPITVLIDLEMIPIPLNKKKSPRDPLAKSHSFERLRILFSDKIKSADLEKKADE